MNNLQNLKKRILDISYKNHESYIPTCLNVVEIIDKIFKMKGKNDPFILSSGCPALAMFVVMEKYYKKDAEELFKKNGIYPHYSKSDGIYCSAGSLGHGIGVAVGYALAQKNRKVYCIISDGECSEGSVWEALRIATELRLKNLIIYVTANGYGAVKTINIDTLEKQIKGYVQAPYPKIHFIRTLCTLPHIQGVQGRYKELNETEYKDLLKAI